MKIIALILAMAAALSWGQGRQQRPAGARTNLKGAGKIMNEAQVKAVEILSLPEPDFYALDDRRILALQSAVRALFQTGAPKIGPPPATPLAPADAPLLAIGLPSRVRVDERTGIPVLVAVRLDGLRRWEAEY